VNGAPTTIANVAGVVGHELRNPLAAVVTGVTLAREMMDAGDPRQHLLDQVLQDLDRVTQLLDSYLDFARTGALRRRPFDPASCCRAVANRHGSVRLDAPAGSCVQGDAALLERAIENLVENALAAGAGSVEIAVRRGDGELRIDIDDDGPGVSPELVGSIFEPGFSRRGSTGLGLAIVAATVAAHGGSARCEPRARGGTRFSLCLPAAAVPSACSVPA
jgi:signal transduction histidine kinase